MPLTGAGMGRWEAPADDGGGEGITKYTIVVTPDPGSNSRTVAGTVFSVLFTGLTNGVAYTFKVQATNSAGDGPWSGGTDAVTPEDGYGTHPVDGGGWQRWWWFNPGSEVDRTVESDVLGHDFGHCRRTDDYCFQRMPPGLEERDTELLGVDSNGNIYRWEFMPWCDTAHAVWRAFTAGIEQPRSPGTNCVWNPSVIAGGALSMTQDRFWYEPVHGFKSLQLDDDTGYCHTTLAMGFSNQGTDTEIGVDYLHDPNCVNPGSFTKKSRGLELFYRYKRSQWFPIIKTRVNDATFGYDSTVWTEGVPFCEHCDDSKNAMYAAYRTKKVRKVRITMNSRTYVWELQPQDYGKYTMHDLILSGARTFRAPNTGSWAGSTTTRWGISYNGHEHYYCNEYAINRHDYGSCCGKARIGAPLSQEYGCGHPGTSDVRTAISHDASASATHSPHGAWRVAWLCRALG